MKNKEVSMEQIEEILSNLYNCEDVTLGVHGTAVIPENKEKMAKNICNKGLMCRYIDVRRTISFQNRGKIHAHGDIGLEELKRYSYKKKRYRICIS